MAAGSKKSKSKAKTKKAPPPTDDAASGSDGESQVVDEPKKTGNPCHFQGQRLEFMRSKWEDYMEASALFKKPGNRHALDDFWRAFFMKYWKKFHWRLTLKEEPEVGAAPVEEKEEDLSEEDREKKANVQKQIKDKIKNWFVRQRNKSASIRSNPFFGHLAEMHGNDTHQPRRPSMGQFLMQHDDHAEAVTTRFNKEHANVPKKDQLAARVALAKKMFGEQPKEVQSALRAERETEHQAALQAYQEAIADEGLPSVDVDVQEKCRSNMAAVLASLLGGVQAYTGYTLNLVAARVSEAGNFDVVSVNTGEVDGEAWPRHDRDAYEQMLKLFLTFVLQVEEEAGKDVSGASVEVAAAAASGKPAPTTAASSGAPNRAPPTTTPPQTNPPIASAVVTPENAPPVHMLAQPNLIRMIPDPPAPNNERVEDEDEDDVMMELGPVIASAATPTPSSTLITTPNTTSTSTTAPNPTAINSTMPSSTTAPTAASSTESWGIPGMTEPMRAELLALNDEERERRVRSLLRLTPDDLQREINAAGYRAHNLGTGLSTVAAFVGMKRAAEKQEQRGKGKRRKRAKTSADEEGATKRKEKRGKKDTESDSEEDSDGAGNGWDGGKDDDGSGEEEEEGEGEATRVHVNKPKVVRGCRPQTRKATLVDWAAAWKEKMMEGERGPDWEAVVDLWHKHEENAPPARIGATAWGTAKRPVQVSKWVGIGRTKDPAGVEIGMSPAQFWAWWVQINPSWRKKAGTLVQEGTGSWDELNKPGMNGLLNVLACLRWWDAVVETKQQRDEWDRAVADVRWALEQMTASIAASANVDVDDDDDDDQVEPDPSELMPVVERRARTKTTPRLGSMLRDPDAKRRPDWMQGAQKPPRARFAGRGSASASGSGSRAGDAAIQAATSAPAEPEQDIENGGGEGMEGIEEAVVPAAEGGAVPAAM